LGDASSSWQGEGVEKPRRRAEMLEERGNMREVRYKEREKEREKAHGRHLRYVSESA